MRYNNTIIVSEFYITLKHSWLYKTDATCTGKWKIKR